MDRYRNELGGLDKIHFMTHKARQFFAAFANAAVATATTVDNLLQTDATHECHVRIKARANQGVQTFTLIEAPTGVTGGAAVTPVNKNRNSSSIATTVIKTGVTGTTGGTSIPLKRITGAYEADIIENEIILKPSTVYVLRLLTGASGTNEIDYSVDFYENVGQGEDKSNG